MKDYIYIFFTSIIRFTLHFIPNRKINATQILFTSYLGKQYSCNPKYISQVLLSQNPKYSIIWAFREPQKYQHLTDQNITVVKYNSLKFIKLCLTSRYIITNTRDLTHIPFSPSQTIINTWHGGGAYKTVGLSTSDVPKSELYRQHIIQKENYVYLSSSKAFTDLTIRNSFRHTGIVLECGMPRNDLLICGTQDSIREKIYSLFKIPENHKLIIYAPTYRKDKAPTDYAFDIETIKDALAKRFGGIWTVLFRTHYYIIKQLIHSQKDFIDVSTYPDMQELLYASDILITDYSSSIWDFSFTYRPCFLYATDLSAYDLKHGFYTDIHSWPFPLAQNNRELVDNILAFNEKKYIQDVKQHHLTLGSYENGTACKQVVDYILSNK